MWGRHAYAIKRYSVSSTNYFTNWNHKRLELPHGEPGPSEAQLKIKDITKESIWHKDRALDAAAGKNSDVML